MEGDAQWIVASVVAVMGALGGGLKWFLSWLFAELRRIRTEYSEALRTQTETFAEALTAATARTDTERVARLADKDQAARDMRELIAGFQETVAELSQRRSDRPRSSPSTTRS